MLDGLKRLHTTVIPSKMSRKIGFKKKKFTRNNVVKKSFLDS